LPTGPHRESGLHDDGRGRDHRDVDIDIDHEEEEDEEDEEDEEGGGWTTRLPGGVDYSLKS
jgi:hypothetical protein